MQKRPVFNHSFSFLLLIFLTNLPAQTVDVSGLISTADLPVQNAAITFIDNSDTTRQFSALTNSAGEYMLRVKTGVTQQETPPETFVLEQNYPNPFSSATAIAYRLDQAAEVHIAIFDILGREIAKMAMGATLPGAHQVVWNGLNNLGERVSPGVYFYRLQAGDKTQVKKMIVTARADKFLASVPPVSLQPLKKASVQAQAEFTIRITNTATTIPLIVPKQIDNVMVQDNTALHFTVDEHVFPNAATIRVDSTFQIIRGFGAANILRWRPDMTTAQIDKAFGTDEGQVGLSILRLRIPPAAGDFRDNVRTAQAAYSRGVKIIASPWSPPAGIKTNNNLVGGRLREDAYADYAAHLKSFADFMADNGAPLYALSIQNEPDVRVDYESCDWNAAEMLKFVKENGADIGADIIAPESFHFDHALSDPMLNDAAAAANVAIIGGHIYGGGLSSYPLAANMGKELWMTEHLDTDTTWAHVFATGKEINDCMNAGMNAYVWWYIVRYYGPIGEDSRVTKRGYVMSQYARFIRPDYVRVFCTRIPQSRVFVTAFSGDSRVVIVAINQRTQPMEQTFVLKGAAVNSFTPYVTSQTENCSQLSKITTSHNNLSFTLASSSITTFVSN